MEDVKHWNHPDRQAEAHNFGIQEKLREIDMKSVPLLRKIVTGRDTPETMSSLASLEIQAEELVKQLKTVP